MPKKINKISWKWVLILFLLFAFPPFSTSIVFIWWIIYFIKNNWSFPALNKLALNDLNKVLWTKYSDVKEVSKEVWKKYSDKKWLKQPWSFVFAKPNEQNWVSESKIYTPVKIIQKSRISEEEIHRNTSDHENKDWKIPKKDKSIWDNYESVLDKF